jgi:hypothetical protein
MKLTRDWSCRLYGRNKAFKQDFEGKCLAKRPFEKRYCGRKIGFGGLVWLECQIAVLNFWAVISFTL